MERIGSLVININATGSWRLGHRYDILPWFLLKDIA